MVAASFQLADATPASWKLAATFLSLHNRGTEFQAIQVPVVRGSRTATPRPAARETRFHRVGFHYKSNDAFQFVHVPHPMIIGLVLPENALPAQDKIALPGREKIHAVANLLAWRPAVVLSRCNPIVKRMEHPVVMTDGHDDERQQLIAFPGKVVEGINDEAGQSRVLQVPDRRLLVQPAFRSSECQFPQIFGPVGFGPVVGTCPALQLSAVVIQVKQAACGNAAFKTRGDEVRRRGACPSGVNLFAE